eukprot:GFYU01060908.1.p1 GENE.GFYU01060908.1~~GFYU01060908.1.p1  ORF type:complete len:167 (-),score=16.38 GFYU01060908.1:11-511(-)
MSRRDQLFLGAADTFTFDFGGEAVPAVVGFGAVDEVESDGEELPTIVLSSENTVRLSTADIQELALKAFPSSVSAFMRRPHPDLTLSESKKKLEDHLIVLTEHVKVQHERARKRRIKKADTDNAPTKSSSRMSHRQKWSKKKTFADKAKSADKAKAKAAAATATTD